MGTVDLVLLKGTGFQRLYVAKRLNVSLRDDESFRAMFLDEARVAGLIRHANVVSVLDAGEDEQGPYLLMDYVEGVTLGNFIRRHRETGTLVPLQLCAKICAQIADGLHAAHELVGPDGTPLALVHRDVSPQNVLIGYDGVCRVTDFGIAKALGQSTKTATGVFKGKLGYMSPEQFRFEKIDRRSDLFSLGVILYELVTSQRLYGGGGEGDGPFRILNEPPPDLGVERVGSPAELTELGFELLAKRRDSRPETAREVARRLQEIGSELAVAEGAVDLADYVDSLFREDRKHEELRIRDAVERTQLEVAADVKEAVTLADSTQSRARSPARTFTMVFAGLAGAVGLAAFWMSSRPLKSGAVTPAVAMAPTESDSDSGRAAVVSRPRKVSIRVATLPAGAQLLVDERPLGRTPTQVELSSDAKSARLRLTLEGYQAIEQQVTADRDRELLLVLTPQPSDAKPKVQGPVARPRPRPEPRPPSTAPSFDRFP